MVVCEGRYTKHCSGIAVSIVIFGEIGSDGMPEPGTEPLRLCKSCTANFLSKNPEATVSPFSENLVSFGFKEIKT